MLKKIFKILKDNKYTNVIYTIDVEHNLAKNDKEFIENNFTVNSINDARSAIFYALGKENLNKKCIILIEGNNIQNVLTGITETWFQKLNIFIIALYTKFDDIKTDFLHRVIPNIIHIYNEDYEEYETMIANAATSLFPSLVTLKYNIKVENYKYDNLLILLNKILNEDDEVFLYNMEKNEKKYNFKINNINEKYKYCVISKYMGYIVGKKKKSILCIPAKLFLLDLNIFNNRYVNKNFKVILYGCEELGKEKQSESWINYNKIKTITINEIEQKSLEEWWKSEDPTMILLKGEI